ncbi:hypothetical protein Kpol_387p12 [Vanderwaltozyma polyspora DSM 70294]|uniref:Mitochondrial group I intron splicing factor CCM1 n=1 Tax=Vanderwaltozyma polyspora (strain ATCC 22028 / DSM 70294 / BCRC 21397 / CBS 2163 / NBRC 10782 / NRRL Y-8283 / UCD 57-17) TaxID=436907 RepID=A7TRY1_VANPO|nr:uncharacterized protein Kpol_387p12 [Vanderwaltozyma polyspora DSM 70294]EDO14986.1 hypothetical protein Kpol_387p12 [Vanderwaltozyma polyspora DSM 70294]
MSLCYRLFVRQFHVSNRSNASQVKEKLNILKSKGIVINKTKSQVSRLNDKKKLKFKNVQKSAYSKQHALHLLQKNYHASNNDLKPSDIGPNSTMDVKFLTKTTDKRMIYTILGVTGEQLRDSVLIAKTVEKFLNRHQVDKAIYLCKLSKSRGSGALNNIIKYYLNENQPKSAIDLFNWAKKWNIPLNEYTHTILFSGLAQQKEPISKKNCETVMKIVNALIEKNELNQIIFNSALSALANGTEVTAMFDLFEKDIKGIKRDSITYTWILHGLSKVENDGLFVEFLNGFLISIPPRHIDSKFLFELCNLLNQRTSNSQILGSTLSAIDKYFDVNIPEKFLKEKNQLIKLPELSHWSITRKFHSNKHIIGLILANSVATKNWEYGLKLFQDLLKEKPYLIDIDMYHKSLYFTIENDPNHCVEKSLELNKQIEENTAVKFSKRSMLIIYKAFEKQSIKGMTVYNEEKISDLLQKCINYMKENEGVKSEIDEIITIPSEAWKFLFRISKNLNSQGKMTISDTNKLFNEYMKAYINGNFDVLKKKPDQVKDERYMLLEAIRLLKVLLDEYVIKTPVIDESSLDNLERQKFLYRRLLLRLKRRLVEKLDKVEKKKIEIIDEEVEKNIKQNMKLVLNNEYQPEVKLTCN